MLYSFYPIAKTSMRRKLLRDVSGVSAYRILRPRLTGLFKRKYLTNSLRFFAGQAVVFGLFLLAGSPWLYLLLWVLPYASVYQVLNRLRAIAEHGGLTRSADRRVTSHHIRQSWLSSIIMVPYGIGWHLAHHVDSGIPFRNLPAFTRALEEDGYITAEHTWPSYRSLWRAPRLRMTDTAIESLLRPLSARSLVASALLGTHPPALRGALLVAFGKRFGINDGTIRVALSRMVDRGELTNREGVYTLAETCWNGRSARIGAEPAARRHRGTARGNRRW